jgi:hypothetical protein
MMMLGSVQCAAGTGAAGFCPSQLGGFSVFALNVSKCNRELELGYYCFIA